jgi:peptide methionine sulfoxide reductase MsrA
MILPRMRASVVSPIISRQISSKATFGAGCYWGTEKFFDTNFNELYPNTISQGRNGFMNPSPNPKLINPTYKQVCTGISNKILNNYFFFYKHFLI